MSFGLWAIRASSFARATEGEIREGGANGHQQIHQACLALFSKAPSALLAVSVIVMSSSVEIQGFRRVLVV